MRLILDSKIDHLGGSLPAVLQVFFSKKYGDLGVDQKLTVKPGFSMVFKGVFYGFPWFARVVSEDAAYPRRCSKA